MVSCVWVYLGLECGLILGWPETCVSRQSAFSRALLFSQGKDNMKVALWLTLTLMLISNAGCYESESPKASPTPRPNNPATRIANDEKTFQLDSDAGLEFQSQARSAAVDFIKQKLPAAIVKGEWSQRYKNNVFWIDVDVEVNGQRVVVPLVLRKFFPETGEPYWRAVLLSTDLRERQRLTRDEEILKQLNEAELELDKGDNQ